MRRLRAFVLGSCLVASGWACDKTVIVKEVPPPSDDADGGASSGGPSSSGPKPLVIDLPGIESGTDVPFEVPAGAIGFNVVIEGTLNDGAEVTYGIQRITDPSGKAVHDDFRPSGGVIRTSLNEFSQLAMASIPQGEGTTATAGTWKLRVGVVEPASRKVKVNGTVRIQSTGDGSFHGGKLDLHVHLPSGLEVDGARTTAADAPRSAGVKQRVDGYFALLSKHLGLDRGEVTFHDSAADFASIETSSEVLRGFAESSGTPDGTQALHILFTNLISIQDPQGENGFAARGLAPGIPGAASVFQLPVSTILITLSPNNPGYDALAMLHESGHFFGLNHTTEYGGAQSDPLSDTPRCEGLGTTGNDIASCPDRLNVMFPSPTNDTGSAILSPTQKRVYQGSPVYKAYKAGTQKTRSLEAEPAVLSVVPRFRRSGAPLSPVEHDLVGSICGFDRFEPAPFLARYGEAATLAQLARAKDDPDLDPVIRARAGFLFRTISARGATSAP